MKRRDEESDQELQESWDALKAQDFSCEPAIEYQPDRSPSPKRSAKETSVLDSGESLLGSLLDRVFRLF